jgi:hypothetical protein
VSVILTVASLGVWGATGRHAYTKYEVTERVPAEVSPDDPFAGTGFYDGTEAEEVVRRKGFHLGIFPVPQGLWDKHIFSVVTLVVPPWALFGLLALRNRRSRRGPSRDGSHRR